VPDQPVRLRILSVPGAKDPDELIRSDPAQWPRLVQAARPVIDFVLDRLANRYDLASGQGKAAAADEVTDILAGIADPIEQAHYVQQVALLLKVGEGAVHRALTRKQRWGTARRQEGEAAQPSAAPEQAKRAVDDDEYALALIRRLRELKAPFETDMDFALPESRALVRALELEAEIPPDLQPYFERIEQGRPLVENFSADQARAELERVRLRLRRRALIQQQDHLRQLIKEASGQPAEERHYASAMIGLSQDLHRIDLAEQSVGRAEVGTS
jgi:DNA primase